MKKKKKRKNGAAALDEWADFCHYRGDTLNVSAIILMRMELRTKKTQEATENKFIVNAKK